MKLTNEQIARVFAMYFNSEIGWETNGVWENVGKDYWHNALSQIINQLYRQDIRMRYKLLLTPLSSMSDEDAIKIAQTFGGVTHLSDEAKVIQVKEIVATNKLYTKQTNIVGSSWFYVFQHLIKLGYAVPLFIEPNHPDNGKDAIELGIAIDATTMLNKEQKVKVCDATESDSSKKVGDKK